MYDREKEAVVELGSSGAAYNGKVSRTESGGTEVEDNREKLHSVPE